MEEIRGHPVILGLQERCAYRLVHDPFDDGNDILPEGIGTRSSFFLVLFLLFFLSRWGACPA